MNADNMNLDWIDLAHRTPVSKIDHIKRKFLDIPYGTHPKQQLDIYLPEEGDGPFPVIFNVHGGGFNLCDKRDFHLYPSFFALREGFAVVAVNYRLSPEVRYPEHIYDVKKAIRWVLEHANEYKLDTQNIFLWGASAGGYLVSMVGATCNTGEMEENQTGSTIPGIRAVAALCPVINMGTMLKQMIPNKLSLIVRYVMRRMVSQFFGSKERIRQLAQASSPENYITEKTPPFYLQHGSMDPAVPIVQSLLFYHVLAEKIGHEHVVMDVLENVTHEGDGNDFFYEKNVMPVLAFFKRYMQAQK